MKGEASYFRASELRTRAKTWGIHLDLLIAIRILPSMRSEFFLPSCGGEGGDEKRRLSPFDMAANSSPRFLEVRVRIVVIEVRARILCTIAVLYVLQIFSFGIIVISKCTCVVHTAFYATRILNESLKWYDRMQKVCMCIHIRFVRR